ncbi:S15A3 protein, partial [Turnix velox]|nr:S15A3 protein [Turnix velox]
GERRPLLGGTSPKGGGVVCVVAAVGLERVAFFSLAANLEVFLTTTFGWRSNQASCALLLLLVGSHLLSPVGGWLADVYLGSYTTVAISFSLALVATSLMPITAWWDGRLSVCGQPPTCSWQHGGTCPGGQPPQQYCAPTIYSSLLVFALGISSIRANLTPFGVNQMRDQGGDTTRRFFNWFYWSVNTGAVFSLLLVAFVQQNVSFLAAYLIPVICLALGFLIFLLATPTYISKPCRGSQVSTIIKLALQSCGCTWLVDTKTRMSQGEPGSPVPNGGVQPGAPSLKEDLENFQMLARTLPVLLTFIPYWVVFFQVQVMFYLQRLNFHVPNIFQHDQNHTSIFQGYVFPDAWLLLANMMVLVALVPLKDHLVDPFLARRGLLPSALKRMGLGMFFSFTSIFTAGVLEWEWPHSMHHNQMMPSALGGNHDLAATLPNLWQVPQYLLMATSELLTSTSGLEFAHTEAPRSMEGAVMGLFFFMGGMGLLVGGSLLTTLPITSGPIATYFFLLAAIQLATCLLVTWISWKW